MSGKVVQWTIGLMFVLGLSLRAAWVHAIPLWQQADEYPHFYYIQHLYTQHTLPVSKPGFPYYQGYQPPLYYAVATTLYALNPDGDRHRVEMGENVEVDWKSERFVHDNSTAIMLRWFSVVLWAGTFWVGYLFVKRVTRNHAGVMLVAMGLLAFLPLYVSNSSAINNDGLVIFLGALFALRLVYTNPENVRDLLWLGVLLGLVILTKYNGLILVFAVAPLLQPFRYPSSLKRLFIVSLPVVALVAPWVVYTTTVYGEPLAVNPDVPRMHALTIGTMLHAGRNLFWSFWAAAGRIYEIHLPIWYYVVVFGGITLVAGVGVFKALLEMKQREAVSRDEYAFAIQSLVTALLLVGVSIYGFSHAVLTAWGKNLYVWLLPLAYLFGLGWSHISSHRFWLLSFPLVLLFTNVLYLFIFVLPYFS